MQRIIHKMTKLIFLLFSVSFLIIPLMQVSTVQAVCCTSTPAPVTSAPYAVNFNSLENSTTFYHNVYSGYHYIEFNKSKQTINIDGLGEMTYYVSTVPTTELTISNAFDNSTRKIKVNTMISTAHPDTMSPIVLYAFMTYQGTLAFAMPDIYSSTSSSIYLEFGIRNAPYAVAMKDLGKETSFYNKVSPVTIKIIPEIQMITFEDHNVGETYEAYYYEILIPTTKYQILNADGSGSRTVNVNTELHIYHRGTSNPYFDDYLYLFYNKYGGISLLAPDYYDLYADDTIPFVEYWN